MPALWYALFEPHVWRAARSGFLALLECFSPDALWRTSTTNTAQSWTACPLQMWSQWNSSRSKPRLLRLKSPPASRFTWKTGMGWTTVLSRRFKWAHGRIAEVKAYGKGLIVALLAALRLAGSSAVAQQVPPSVAAVVNVSADELLAQPIGANWTSYNGDYTGRRYSILREISPQNVA